MSDGAPSTSKLLPAERVAELERRLKQRFAEPRHAVEALTHRTWCNEHQDEPWVDNERLEFLGDAVVDLAISQRLMERFPQADEGELSKLRALIVNEEGLARIARSLGLGELLLLGRGEDLMGGREKPSLLADVLEAVLGALYLGGGMPAVLQVVDDFFAEALAGVADGRQGRDSKSLLMEAAQARLKATPRYRVVAESGPEHEKVFEVEVLINGEPYGRSTGRSKKEAEQASAELALSALDQRG